MLQDDDAFVLVGDAQLFFAAHHALVVDAAQLAPFERHFAGFVAVPVPNGRAFHGERAPYRRVDSALVFVREKVGSAGHALFGLLRAIVDHGQHEAVGIGMRAHLDDAPQQQLVAFPDEVVGCWLLQVGQAMLRQADVADVRDFQPGQGQALGQQLDRDVDVNEVTQPGNGD